MTIDHIGVTVSDMPVSLTFFTKALKPLGIELVAEDNGWVGFGRDGKAEFWFGLDEPVTTRMHIAFAAKNREQVDQFYQAAIDAGAKDNGLPGVREQYHPNYYGAFVIGPDGHNIEAVCHNEE